MGICEEEGFCNFRVNHQYNLTNPDTKIHTQTIKNPWGSLQKYHVTARHHVESDFIDSWG